MTPAACPAVSVLLPVKAGGPHLDRSLQSLVRQTFGAFEIVAVADGEPALLQQLHDWATRDPRLVVVAGPGRGLVAALEAARNAARAPLLMRHDGDDVSHPERMQLQRAAIEQQRADLVGAHVCFFPRPHVGAGLAHYQAWLNGCASAADIEREALVEIPLAHPTWMVSAAALEAVGGYREMGWAEDYDLFLRLRERGFAIGTVPRALVAIRQHAGRTTWRDPRCSLTAFFRCKAHFLVRGPLRGERPFVIWGAGQAGRMLGKALAALDRRPEFFVDIDPRKIGGRKCGVPVKGPDALAAGAPLVLAAVGTRGARPIVRARLRDQLGLREGEQFLVTA